LEAWLDFFLADLAETANQAFEAATRIVDLLKEDRERIMNESDRAGSALRIHDLFQQNPFLTSNQLVRQTGLSAPTVNAAFQSLAREPIHCLLPPESFVGRPNSHWVCFLRCCSKYLVKDRCVYLEQHGEKRRGRSQVMMIAASRNQH
jgi:hypothetical protein